VGVVFDRLQLFVPDARLESKTTPVDLHARWVVRLMRICADLFGGATSYGRGTGAWKSGEDHYWDRVTVVEAWADTKKRGHVHRLEALTTELTNMGQALRQKAVAYVVNGGLQVMDIEESNPCRLSRKRLRRSCGRRSSVVVRAPSSSTGTRSRRRRVGRP